MKDPKAIRKAIMTAKNIAAMVDPHFARVPLPDIGEPAPEMVMPEPQRFAEGGEVDDHVVNNPMSIFPKPQRMWDEDMPGGAYLSMPDKADVTGHKAAQASIGIGEGGKPYFHASRDHVDETGTPGKGSALVKTNLFKQKAGWRWMHAPEGHENTATIVSVEHRGNHHYVMDAHFPNGVELSRYPDAPSEPRLRPTTRGNVELGPQVGSILVRGREHPVHSHAIVREYGGRVGYADGGMSDDEGVDRQGNLSAFLGGNHPLVPDVVYHGTDRDISEFDTEKPRRVDAGMDADNTDTGWYGKGHYFTPHKRAASSFASDYRMSGEHGPNVMPVHLSLKNPFIVKVPRSSSGAAEMDRAMDEAGFPQTSDERLISKGRGERLPSEQTRMLTDAGHDGVIVMHQYGIKDRDEEKAAEAREQDAWERHQAAKNAFYEMPFEDGKNAHVIKPIKDEFLKTRREYHEAKEAAGGEYHPHELVVFKPHQVKSAIGNSGLYDPHEAEINKAAGGEVDDDGRDLNDFGLYSHAAEQAGDLARQDSPENYKSMLLKRGVKPAELQWSGYDETFANQPKITREQVVEHFQKNMPDLYETQFGGGAEPKGLQAMQERHGQEQRQNALNIGLAQLHGREHEGESSDEMYIRHGRERRALRSEPFHEDYTIPGGRKYREVLVQHNSFGGFPGVKAHFGGEPDVISSLRLKDRDDREGNKILHLEELQSDWGQQGRQKGFRPNDSKSAIDQYNDYKSSLRDLALSRVSQRFKDAGQPPEEAEDALEHIRRTNDPERLAFYAGGNEEIERHNSLRDQAENAKKGVNSAAYVTKTDDWVDLGLKRALLEAAKGGYDKLAWSPGDVHADRYDLSKHIKEIHHEKNDDGTYNLIAYGHSGGAKVYDKDDIPEGELENLLGKEMAKKIISGEGQDGKESYDRLQSAKKAHDEFVDRIADMHADKELADSNVTDAETNENLRNAIKRTIVKSFERNPHQTAYSFNVGSEYLPFLTELKNAEMDHGYTFPYSPYRNWRKLSGLDLKVGGEGMRKFYDEMLPKRLMKLAKQHEPETRLSSTEIVHPEEHGDDDYQPDVKTSLHSIDITPRMRESILKKGFAAYAAGGEVESYQDPASRHISDWNWRPVEDVQESLGNLKEIPSHVEKFGDFMDNIAERAGRQGLTPRDLIKAYTITRSSIQRQAANVDKLRASGLDLPEDMTGKIRPEGAFGEWLHTPAGQAYLDAAEKGKVHQTAIRNAVQVMAPFGRHTTDIPDALTWAALNLPGKEKQVSELIHAGREMVSSPEQWRAFTQHIRGVGPSKSGFLASLMGRGDQPTLDARQIILHTGRPSKEASKYIAKKGGAGGVEAVDRLSARQTAMNLSLPDRLKPYYQHLTHHAVWDKAGNDETTHEDVVRAMHHAANGGAQGDGEGEGILSHPVAKIFQTIGMAGLGNPDADPAKFKEYLKKAQYALARPIVTKGSDVAADYPGASSVKMSKFGKPLEEMESTAIQKGFMLPRKEADLEEMQRRKARIFPFLGDLSPADRVLLKVGQTTLTDPSEQQGGADFMRSEFAKGSDPAAYGNRAGMAKTLAKKIASQTPEGTPAIGTHVAMGLASVDSSHHAYEPILRMIPHSPIAQKHIDEFDDMMREALPASKKYPMAWPGIMNTKEAEQFFASRPGTHASFFAKKIDSAKWRNAGFPDIGEVRFSAATPELLGSPRLSTARAFSQIEPSGRVINKPDLKHKTYPALIPSEGEGYLGGSSTPIPAKLMFSDFYKTMKTKDKSGKAIDYDSPAGQTLFQQSLLTKVPYQDATQEWLDSIMEDRRQKEERGFKKGGKVRSALMIAKGLKKK